MRDLLEAKHILLEWRLPMVTMLSMFPLKPCSSLFIFSSLPFVGHALILTGDLLLEEGEGRGRKRKESEKGGC